MTLLLDLGKVSIVDPTPNVVRSTYGTLWLEGARVLIFVVCRQHLFGASIPVAEVFWCRLDKAELLVQHTNDRSYS